MLRLTTLVLAACLLGSPQTFAADGDRTQEVHFGAGKSGTSIKDHLRGRESVLYKLSAQAGQEMSVRLTSSNQSLYFNVYEPGRGPGDEALANSEMTGATVPEINNFKGTLAVSGEYTISVYLYRNAARRNERAQYTLDIGVAGATATAGAGQSVDALVPGTDYNATGDVECVRDRDAATTRCAFGVKRQGSGTASVTVTWPDGGSRTILFKHGKAVDFDRSQADGNAELTATRESDNTIVLVGEQRFVIPDVIVFGD